MQRSESERQFSTVTFMAATINGEVTTRMLALQKTAELISPSLMANPAELQKFLEDKPVLQILFNAGNLVTDPDGTTIADVPISTGRTGVNYMDREYMPMVLKEGRPTISQPVMGKILKSPIIVMAMPIQNEQGKVIGALTGVTDLGKPSFLDKVAEGNYGKTGVYSIVSKRFRLIITASNKDLVMTNLPEPGINSLIDSYCRGFEGSARTTNLLGVEVLVSVKAVPIADWYVAASLPLEEAFAPIREMEIRIFYFTVFLTLLIGILTWLMLKYQLSPMFAAVKMIAARVNADAPPELLPISEHDEIGDLIGAFNTLLETLGQREDKIQKLLLEKDIILKEVHHRIKNNMGTIKGLLSLQAGTISEPAAIAALNDSGSRVESMMLLYESLFQSGNATEMSAQEYFPSLVRRVAANFPNYSSVKIETKIDDFVLSVKKLQPLGIIINELITNIMKYAFSGRDEGFVLVSVSIIENHVSLVVQDNGNGLPASVDFKNSTGFGLMLVGMLTEQINGTIRIERENGTKLIIEFDN